jgi:2-dehydro-3-deoxyphosphogluconate aldolase/(4S)-4-hydroxy-2-oxoglutarate aldolase
MREAGRSMKRDVLRRIEKHGIVAIIRNIQKETLDEVVDALYRGGVTIVEVTCNTPGYLAMIERLSQRRSQSMLVGAGTVIDTVLAREVIAAGARFLLAPNLMEEVIAIAAEYDIPIIPGVMSPTEVVKAHHLGAAMVKLFPAGTLVLPTSSNSTDR